MPALDVARRATPTNVFSRAFRQDPVQRAEEEAKTLTRSPIERDPYGFLSERLGDRFTSLFGADPQVSEGIRQRYERNRGGRGRAAQLGLQARGGDIPGAYGVTSVLSELGEQSDLSRDLGEANLQEAGRARDFREDYSRRIQDFLERLYEGYIGTGQENQRMRLASDLAPKQKRNPIRVGFGPVSASFARGGVVTRPTRALLGEDGPEAVIPLTMGGRDLFRSRLGMGRLGSMDVPGAADDGDPSTLPLPPAPYQEPAPVRPQGVLERIGELSRMIRIELGDDAPGVLKALALGAGGVAAIGESRLKRRESERGRAGEAVDRLNKRQEQRYAKELEIAGRAPGDLSERTRFMATHEPVPGQPGKYRTIPQEPAPPNALQMSREERAQANSDRLTKASERQATLAEVNTVGKLIDDYRVDNDIKAFQTTRRNLASMRSAAQQRTGSGDMAMIFSYMRLLEPENPSVVREGEYKSAREAIGKLPQLANTPSRYLTGANLTEEGRKAFIRTAEGLLRERKIDYDQAHSQFRDRATAFGVDPKLVLREYGDAQTGGGTVRFRGKDGKVYDLPAGKAAEARRRGYEEVK